MLILYFKCQKYIVIEMVRAHFRRSLYPTNIGFLEHAQAFDFVDRALFTYERSFIGAFNFTAGLNRLDFDHVENRPFFLAVHRQIAYAISFLRSYTSSIIKIGICNAEVVYGPHLNLRGFYFRWIHGLIPMDLCCILTFLPSKVGCINGSSTSSMYLLLGEKSVLARLAVAWTLASCLDGHTLGL